MCTLTCCGKLTLLLCATIALVMSIATSYLGVLQEGQIGRLIGLYEEWNTSTIWSRRGMSTNSTFTPLGWAFNAWIVIYAYQLIVMLHCWTTLCRRAGDRGLLCSDPDLAPAGFIFWHFIASLLNMAWIFLADRVDNYPYLLVPQVCVLFALCVSLVVSLTSSYYWLWAAKSQLMSNRCAYWLVVVLVQNGVSLYAGWVLFASFLNLDVTLTMVAGLTNETSSFVCLAILNSLIAAYVVMDLTTMDHVLRFIFTPHIVWAWASGTALGNNFEGWTVTNVLLLLLISIVGVGLLLKLISACVRSRLDPLFPKAKHSYSLQKAP